MKVLLGFDGTDQSVRALEETLERAREADDDLTVALYETEENMAHHRAVVRERSRRVGVDPTLRVLTGDPGREIVTLAQREDFDRIVLGGGRKTPTGKIQLGDRTEFVLLNADTTVTIVR